MRRLVPRGGSWEFRDELREKTATKRDCSFSGLLGNQSIGESFLKEEWWRKTGWVVNEGGRDSSNVGWNLGGIFESLKINL